MSNPTAAPGLTFAAEASTGIASAAPTMPIAALAWSAEAEPDDAVVVPAAAVPRMRPQPTRRSGAKPAALAAVLFGVVTAGALGGAIMFGGNDSPVASRHVEDRTAAAPYVPVAPVRTVAAASVPAETADAPAPALTAPKTVAIPVPAAAPVDQPTEHHWDDHHRREWIFHHLQEHGDREGHGNKR